MTKVNPKRSGQRPKKHTRGKEKLSSFARSLWNEWKKLDLPAHELLVVAVSGGADSVALFLAVDELIKAGRLRGRMLAAHLDHCLRGKAGSADALWVQALVRKFDHTVKVGRIDVKKRAAKTGDNLEQAARRARYEFLEKVARVESAKVILTAHTMDDQAETVLMNLLRGSGAGGLGGVEPVRLLNPKSEILLARPLLSWALRQDTENYCRQREVEYRSDAMNLDEKFARVRVRRQLLPLMQTFNPKLVAGLTRTAELLREDHSALDRGAARLLELSYAPGLEVTSLRFDLLASSPPALRRRALRLWIEQCRGDLKRLERVHIAALERLVLGDRGGRVIELPGGGRVSRNRGLLQYSG